MSDAPEPPPAHVPSPAAGGRPATTTRDRVLLVVFWAWAVVLVVATLAHLLHWQGVLDALDVKRWFSR
jgi:hypothetical protein